jgi:hypothetical protein
MNSDKAAAVRDSINGCPEIVNDDDLVERDRDPITTHRGDTLTGDKVDTDRSMFRPAYIHQSGTLGDGNGSTRPVHVVVLETLWHKRDDVRLLSSSLVYEVAKHDCNLRFYPPEHRLGGAIWVTDPLTADLSNTDGDRCPECESTYFKIRDGEPECARCGEVQTEAEQATLSEVA